MKLKNLANQVIQLDTLIARGGEGQIWTVKGQPKWVAKIYDPTKLTPFHEIKLRAMLANPPTQPSNHAAIAWPLDMLYQQGQFVGFIMPWVDGKPAFHFYLPHLRQQHDPSFNWQYLHRAALNLTLAMQAIHDKGHVVGDVNESNILLKPTALVTLVDSDSFQIRDQYGQIYRCLVGKPEYTPPELQGLNFKTIDRRPEHDLFGLGVIVFQLLMNGYHPFAGVLPLGSPSVGRVDLYCIKEGVFPYQATSQAKPPPHAPLFSQLHPDLQAMFMRCFVTGHHQPDQRPTARQWQQALETAQAALIPCRREANHVYSNHLTHCPWCELAARPKLLPQVVRQPQPIPSPKPQPVAPSWPTAPPPTRSTGVTFKQRVIGAMVSQWVLVVFVLGMVYLVCVMTIAPYLFSCSSVTSIPQTECDDLVALYYSIDGIDFLKDQRWLVSDNPCLWEGVRCSGGHVVSIEFIDDNLNGTLPPLNQLTYLQELMISGNPHLTGTIPNFALPHLTILWLSGNQLSGNIPNFNLPQLKELILHGNKLTGTIPDFNSLPRLQKLNLFNNKLTGTIPDFKGTPRLEWLNLSNNKLTGTIPDFKHSHNLQYIELQGNELK